MKKMPMFALAIASALIVNPANLQADADDAAPVSITAPSDFYAPLGQYGIWVQVNDYGRCFRPTDAGVGWRPYCNGHWEWTDDGWYWDSDQPWAWACYHYGQWTYDSHYGWVWVPGAVWAPAWVSWRIGDHYIGWAPTPPEGRGRFRGRDADDDAFVFVPANRFDEPVNTSDIIVNKPEVIEHTRYVSNMKTVTKYIPGVGTEKICDNEGPGLNTVEKASGKTFRPVPVRDVYGRRASATRYDSGSPHPHADRHEETNHHEHSGHGSWPPANTRPDTGRNQSGYQQRQAGQPDMNAGQHSIKPSPLPNYNPQAAPEQHQTMPNEGSTHRQLQQLHSGQPHTTPGANAAGHRVPEKAVSHGKAIQRRQGNTVPANSQGQDQGGQNRNPQQ